LQVYRADEIPGVDKDHRPPPADIFIEEVRRDDPRTSFSAQFDRMVFVVSLDRLGHDKKPMSSGIDGT